MKIKTLIKKLQKLEETHGNIDVSVHDADPDNEGPVDYGVCLISWFSGDRKENKKGMKKADSVMICSRSTAMELS